MYSIFRTFGGSTRMSKFLVFLWRRSAFDLICNAIKSHQLWSTIMEFIFFTIQSLNNEVTLKELQSTGI